MKTKYVYVTTAILCVFVLLVVYKLNDYYKSEKMQALQIQMNQQNGSLKTSMTTQLGQLKNILSSYSYRIDESKLNWVQMDPMTVMAQTHIAKSGLFEVKNIFTKSGAKTERWNKEFLQKALSLKKYSGKPIHVDLFQTKSGDKYIAFTFIQSGVLSSQGYEAVTVVGEANYFQKFFDLSRSKKMTHVLMTDLNTVAGHTEADYVATLTSEGSLNLKKYFVQIEELRSTNLKIISYAAKSSILSFLNIPMMLLGLILGFVCILVGILFYAFLPIEKTIQAQKIAHREQIYQKTVLETAAGMQSNEAVTTTGPGALPELKLKPIELPVNVSVEKTDANPKKTSQSVFESRAAVVPAVGILQKEFNLSVPLNLALDALKSKCATFGIRVHTEISTMNLFEFEQPRFQKMFDQILKNAIESMENSKTKNIFVRCYDQSSSTVVEIQDTGIGITAENSEKIWQPYFTTKNKNQHPGLGLSEALSVARRYGGDLVVSQNQNGGTLVRLIMNGNHMENEIENTHVPASVKNDDLDLDQILNLDQDDSTFVENSKPFLDLKKEFATTQFKIGHHVEILEDPEIEFKKNEKLSDQFKVHIRGPQKS